MEKLINLILFKSDMQAQELAKDLGVTKQQISRLKKNKNIQLEKLVKWKEKYKLSWQEIGDALEHDYSDKEG